MTSYKQLLQAKYNHEAHLYDVNVKLQKMQQEGKPLSKQRDALNLARQTAKDITDLLTNNSFIVNEAIKLQTHSKALDGILYDIQ
jgi:hypothetical protein